MAVYIGHEKNHVDLLILYFTSFSCEQYPKTETILWLKRGDWFFSLPELGCTCNKISLMRYEKHTSLLIAIMKLNASNTFVLSGLRTIYEKTFSKNYDGD